MVSQNMANILAQYRTNVGNIMSNNARPTYDLSTVTPMATGNWVGSYNPTTANAATKAALTTVKNNAWADAGQGVLHGLGTALDWLDKPRNALDSALSTATSSQPHSLGDVLQSGWQGLTDQKHTSFSDLMDQWGWKKAGNWSIKDPLDISHGGRALAGFLGDVVTDPLTYLSFGAEGVGKSIMKPFVDRALEEIGQKGVQRGSEEAMQILDKHLSDGENVMKAAQAKANKAGISVGVPFMNKYTLMNKPSFLQKQTQMINPNTASSLAANMSSKLGSGNVADQARYDIMSHVLGRPITSTKDLNTQEYDFMNKIWNDHLAQSADTHMASLPDPFAGGVTPKAKAPKAEWQDFVNKNWESTMGQKLPVDVSKMNTEDLKQLANKMSQQRTLTQANHLQGAVNNIKNDFSSLGKQFVHHDGLTGVSPLVKKMMVKDTGNGLEATKLGKAQENVGKLLGTKRFVSVANQIKDHRVLDGLGHMVNASNKAYAYSHDMIQQLRQVAKTPEFKSLTPDEWKEVAYTIEAKHPSHAGYVPPTPERQAVINKVASTLAGDPNNPTAPYFMKNLNDLEAKAGVTHGGNTNSMTYFPHVYNLPKDQSFQDLQSQLLNMGDRGQQILGGLKNSSAGFQKGRTEFGTMADLQDFLHAHQGTAVADKFKNVSWNPLEAYGKRAIVGMNQVAKHEAINEVTKTGLAISGKSAPAGWKEIGSVGDHSPLKGLEGKYVPPEIHKDLTTVNKLLTSNEDLNHFLDKADKVMSVLRRNYTVTKVGFHIRQIIGNVFQNTLAGVTPTAYAQAAKYLANPDKFKGWTKEILENGIIHTGSSNADLAHNLGSELSNRMNPSHLLSVKDNPLNPLGKNFALGTVGRKAGEMEDNLARIAHYMYMRKKGMTQEQAANSVRKYLYNYAEANNTTRAIRNVIPFYQWMRNNLPFQILNAAKSPKAYNIAQNFLKDFQNEPDGKTAMEHAGINNPVDQETMQKIINENGGVLPSYIKDNYIDIGNGNYYNIGLPTQDVRQAVENPAAYFFGGLNPYLNLIHEMNSNQSSLNNAPIDKSVPTGEGIWSTPAGLQHIAETAIGSPVQLAEGQFAKGFGVNTQNMNFDKQLQILASQKAKDLSTRAKYLKQQANGGS